MADNNKVLGVGKTVYLKDGEKFDSVRMPSGTVGPEQPLASNSSVVRASAQSPAKQIRVISQNQSVVRAAAQPQQNSLDAEQKRQQFLRASRMPVRAEDIPQEPVQEKTPEKASQFVRASAMPFTRGDDVAQAEQPVQQAPEIQSAREKMADIDENEKTEQEKSNAQLALELLSRSRAEPKGAEETFEDKSLEEGERENMENENIFSEISVELKPEIKEEAKQEKPVQEKKRPKMVDINKLTVVNKTEIDKERDLRQALYNNKAAFQIVAAQSGYVAKVAPLVHKDLVNILYSNLSAYEQRKSVYKTVHEKVFETSVGKMEFDSWLRNTTVEDMETFYYGIYSSTFPNEGNFRFACPKCNKEHDYKVNHANLIKTTDRESMKRLIDDVSRNSTTVEKMRQFSLIGKNQAVEASESKLVFELRTPSLFDALEILRTVPEKTIDKDVATVTNMLYVNKSLIPSKDGGYTEESGRAALLRIIDNLPIGDAKELEVAVFDRVDENRISYSIKNIKCSDCAHEEKEIPISIENILFTLIFEKAQ